MIALPTSAERGRAGQALAFVRRDFLELLSYRAALATAVVGLLAQVAIFSFVAEMIDPATLPTYAGRSPTYLEFVTVGITVGAFLQLGLSSISGAVRREQLIGTLEPVFATPVTPGLVQFGSVAFGLLYATARIVVFLVLATTLFQLDLAVAGLLPAVAVNLMFLLVIAGAGCVAGAAILTFRRGGGAFGAAGMALGAVSGAYFPVDLLPWWLEGLVRVNPVAIALEGTRLALLGGGGWVDVRPAVASLALMAVPSLWLGTLVFRAALRREIARGSLGTY